MIEIEKLRVALGKIDARKTQEYLVGEHAYPAKLLKRFVNTFRPEEIVEVWQEEGKLCFKWNRGRAHFNPMGGK